MLKVLLKIFLIFIIAAIGLLSGHAAGKRLVSGLFSGKRQAFFLYKIPADYFKTLNLLNSDNELNRLEGYYSLLDNNIIDADFLIKRYKSETDFLKPVIVWLLGFSKDKDMVLKFLNEEYEKSGKRLKQEISRTMKRFEIP